MGIVVCVSIIYGQFLLLENLRIRRNKPLRFNNKVNTLLNWKSYDIEDYGLCVKNFEHFRIVQNGSLINNRLFYISNIEGLQKNQL